MCFHCAYWDRFINTPDKYEVVGGKIYEYGDPLFLINTKSGRVRTRYIIHHDRSIKRIHFSRYIGDVPEGWDIPDTGSIIDYKTFKRIEERNSFQCRAIGCYDRYHCLFYDAKQMEPDGPWNVVPKSHRIGGERCQSFINKDKIFTNKNKTQ